MFADKIFNTLSTLRVGVPGPWQLQWAQPPFSPASPGFCQDTAAKGFQLLPVYQGQACCLFSICLSAEVSEVPFNVNISSKTFHFLTHNTFPDFRDLLFMFHYPFLLLFPSALKILVS